MTMQGIDIASYQAGIDTTGATVPLDFVIVKATQGTGYVNPDCARAVDQALDAGKAVGVYHYIDGAAGEADFFCDQISGWVGRVLVCLDWEPGSNGRWGDEGYLGAVIDRVRARTGRPPVVYASASAFPWQTCAARDCGTWVAQYADMNQTGYQDHPWNEDAYSCTIRQYSSTGRLPGWGADLDLDIFYGDRNTWNAYVGATSIDEIEEEDMPSAEEIANAVLDAQIDYQGGIYPGGKTSLRNEIGWTAKNFDAIPGRVWGMNVKRNGLPEDDPRAGKEVSVGGVLSYMDAFVLDIKNTVMKAASAVTSDERVIKAVREAVDEIAQRKTAEPGTTPAAALAADVHIVAAGETLKGIAAQANVDMQAIVDANPGLEPNRLVAGQRITIPTTKE